MELRTYLAILGRRKWVVVATTAITLIVTAIGTFLATPVYRASTTLRVSPAASSTDRLGWDDIQYADRLMNTYSQMATSDPLLRELARRLGLSKAPKLEVDIPANTELMHITVEDQNPTLARDAANSLADILIAQVHTIYSGSGQTAQEILKEQLDQVGQELHQARKDFERMNVQSPHATDAITAAQRLIELKEGTYANLLGQYDQARVTEALRANTISVFEPAAIPDAPAKPRKTLNIALALLVGLVGGLGLVFLFENLDTTLYTSPQIEAFAGLPVLGNIPSAKQVKQIAVFNNHPSQEEAFRRLSATILALQHDAPFRSLLVTSAEPGEGKSTLVANLACALAEARCNVIVVDGDLRLPATHTIFGLSNQFGLSSVLQKKIVLDEALQDTAIPRLRVLTSGPLQPNPAALLGLPEMQALLEDLARQSDIILFDTPALLAVTDAALLARIVDGVVTVIGRSQARQEAVRAALRQLDNVKARMVGIVVNRGEPDGIAYTSSYRQPIEQTQSFHYPGKRRNREAG